MGDGIRILLAYISSIIAYEKGIVFIDEIENGLHYSTHKILWKAIIKAAQENDVQIFASTHNSETLKYLLAVADEKHADKDRDEIKLFRIRNLSNGIFKSYRYDFPEFKHAIEQENEIR